MAKTGAVTITNIPLDLRQAFKARCVMQGKSHERRIDTSAARGSRQTSADIPR